MVAFPQARWSVGRMPVKSHYVFAGMLLRLTMFFGAAILLRFIEKLTVIGSPINERRLQ